MRVKKLQVVKPVKIALNRTEKYYNRMQVFNLARLLDEISAKVKTLAKQKEQLEEQEKIVKKVLLAKLEEEKQITSQA